MTGAEGLVWGALAAAGLAGSALASGFETGVYTVDRIRLDAAASAAPPDPAARRLSRELARPDRLLTTILLTNNAANYAGTLGVAGLISGFGVSELGAIALNAVVLTPVLLVLGEILPKELFRAGTDRLTLRLTPAMTAVRLALTLTGVVPVMTRLGRVAGRLTGAGDTAALGSGRERVVALLQEGVRAGVLSDRQSGLIDRVMELRDTPVTAVMQPWNIMHTLGAVWSLARARDVARAHPRNRYIVVNSRGRPVGSVSAAVLWSAPHGDVAACMGPVGRVAPEDSAGAALASLAGSGRRVAVVETDGGVLGVVSVRSLIEPLAGELGPLDV